MEPLPKELPPLFPSLYCVSPSPSLCKIPFRLSVSCLVSLPRIFHMLRRVLWGWVSFRSPLLLLCFSAAPFLPIHYAYVLFNFFPYFVLINQYPGVAFWQTLRADNLFTLTPGQKGQRTPWAAVHAHTHTQTLTHAHTLAFNAKTNKHFAIKVAWRTEICAKDSRDSFSFLAFLYFLHSHVCACVSQSVCVCVLVLTFTSVAELLPCPILLFLPTSQRPEVCHEIALMPHVYRAVAVCVCVYLCVFLSVCVCVSFLLSQWARDACFSGATSWFALVGCKSSVSSLDCLSVCLCTHSGQLLLDLRKIKCLSHGKSGFLLLSLSLHLSPVHILVCFFFFSGFFSLVTLMHWPENSECKILQKSASSRSRN